MRTKKLTFEQVIAIMDKMQTMINPLIELAKQKQQSELPKMANGSVLNDLKSNVYKNNTEWYKGENQRLREEIETIKKENIQISHQLLIEREKNYKLNQINQLT